MCALKSSTSPVRHTHRYLNNKYLFKFREELQLILWKLNIREGSGNFPDTDNPPSELLDHISPPVSAHVWGEVHCRCTTVEPGGIFTFSVKPHCPLLHFPQARAVKRRSWRNTESQWRGVWLVHITNEDFWAFALSSPCKLPCKLWTYYMYNRQKPILGLKWGSWEAENVHSLKMIKNWELGETRGLKY